jgi:RNAse (barnase) inhibitor barstar
VKNVVVPIDASRIVDAESFHSAFAAAFGFPGFYGKNMDAWIDCMTSLDQPADGMTTIHVDPGHVVVIQLDHAREFAERCPDLYAKLIECSAFVNWRLLNKGHEPLLALSFAA